jgi:hypothetical protein
MLVVRNRDRGVRSVKRRVDMRERGGDVCWGAELLRTPAVSPTRPLLDQMVSNQ